MAMMYAERAPSRQIAGATAVIGVHAALIFAIVTGLAGRPPLVTGGVTEVVDVPAVVPPDEPAPPPRPVVGDTNWRLDVPEPRPTFDDPPAEDVITGQYVEQTFYDPPAMQPTQPSPMALRSDPRHPLAPPDYPATDVRLGHEGTVRLLIYVLPSGRVGDVKIAKSSGYPLMDASAVRKAKAAWRFLPATSGSGQAIAAWGTYDVRFELKLN